LIVIVIVYDYQSTPFNRKVDASGVVTGGVDTMIEELLETVRAQEAAKGSTTCGLLKFDRLLSIYL